MAQRVSVIITVLNEVDTIDRLLHSLLGQTRQPDEVVIVDGGSSDGTMEKLERFSHAQKPPVTVLCRPGCSISEGRNVAIAAAQGAIVASTDAGVRLAKDWLEQLVAPFEGDDPPAVVSGFFISDPGSLFERVLGAVTLPRLQEIDASAFHPSSRSVAFRREAWEAVGGYPEWLDYCEDLVFDFALRDAGYKFAFAPRAVAHFRPRPTLRAYLKQYYRYARGDGKADLWRYRHLVRYATYLVALPLLLAFSVAHHPLWLLALAGGALAMMRTPIRRLWPDLGDLTVREKLTALCWMPIIRCSGDIAKMVGYPAGVCWRWRHAPKGTWAKRQL